MIVISPEQQLCIVQIKHPRTGQPCLVGFPSTEAGSDTAGSKRPELYEIRNVTNEKQSWIIENTVQNSNLLLSTPLNPIFVVLPGLLAASRTEMNGDVSSRPGTFIPMDDLVDYFPKELQNHIQWDEYVERTCEKITEVCIVLLHLCQQGYLSSLCLPLWQLPPPANVKISEKDNH